MVWLCVRGGSHTESVCVCDHNLCVIHVEGVGEEEDDCRDVQYAVPKVEIRVDHVANPSKKAEFR